MSRGDHIHCRWLVHSVPVPTKMELRRLESVPLALESKQDHRATGVPCDVEQLSKLARLVHLRFLDEPPVFTDC